MKLSVQHEGSNKKCKKNCASLTQRIGVSTSTAWEICRDDLSLFQYKIQLSQQFSGDGMARNCAFASEYGALLEDNPGVLNVTWFSDEAHLHLDSYFNKKNVGF
jgi:hypothetical protein